MQFRSVSTTLGAYHIFLFFLAEVRHPSPTPLLTICSAVTCLSGSAQQGADSALGRMGDCLGLPAAADFSCIGSGLGLLKSLPVLRL